MVIHDSYDKKILLWGLPEDGPTAAVNNALSNLGLPVLFVNQHYNSSLLDMMIDMHIGCNIEGTLKIDKGKPVDLKSLSAAYLRPYNLASLAEFKNNSDIGSEDRLHIARFEDSLLCWAELTAALVINRPAAMSSNGSKPYQAKIIELAGFEIPDTLITTDPKAVVEFWKNYEKIIYKSISGIRSIVSSLTPQRLENIDDVRWCPTQFQEYVPGVDYRIHVVGDEIFACQIMSIADDYRYASRQGMEVNISPCVIPDDVADRCRSLALSFGLVVAGIDLRCTPQSIWYCFEVNPSPAFVYYQNLTGQKIDEAIAHLMARTLI